MDRQFSVFDYGQTNLLKLDIVQYEAIRMGTTKDTPTETMRFMLDFPSAQCKS